MTDPTPLVRPILLPGLTRLWRDRHTLQLGELPGRAVLLEMSSPGTAPGCSTCAAWTGTRRRASWPAYARSSCCGWP
ncbi:hypothetical protein AB0F83_24575, partial [Micromonospora chalcea]